MNLNDMLINTVSRVPEKILFRAGDRSVTYEQFHRRVCRAANALLMLGAGYQERVAVIGPNSVSYAEVIFACAKSGRIVDLINWRLSHEKICRILAESDAKVVVISMSCAKTLDYLQEHLPRQVKYVLLDGENGAALSYEQLLAAQKDTFQDKSCSGDEIVFQLYTSGTTGREKGVMITHENVLLKCLLLQRELPYEPDDIVLGILPFFHVAVIGLLSTICAGCTYVFGAPVPEAIAAAIAKEKVTRVTLVPSILGQVVRYLEQNPMDVSSIKIIGYGAAPMTPELLRCKKVFNCKFTQGYGMTETMSSITVLLPEHHSDERNLCTVGKPLMGTHIRIVDVDGKPCSAGDVGEIVVHQPTLMKGYYNRPELTEQAIRDGWYYTGDIGFLDEKGFLHLLDRRSSMVISGGENIFPKEVEDCILKYLPDRISELAVIGVPDQTWGEVLMLAVVVEKGACLTEEDIYDVCRAHLDSFKKPRHIYFMDHIPRNEAGKVARQKLLEYHEAQIQNQNK